MSKMVRERALETLRDWKNRTEVEIHNAIIDIRRDPKIGDERFLYSFLDHDDDMVASATLYTLYEVHGLKRELRQLLFNLAGGDPRDTDEMPIQCTAIKRLAEMAATDQEAYKKIVMVAEDTDMAEVPRKVAWSCLAELHRLDWPREYSTDMIWDPHSEKSERIREWVREAMRCVPVQKPHTTDEK